MLGRNDARSLAGVIHFWNSRSQSFAANQMHSRRLHSREFTYSINYPPMTNYTHCERKLRATVEYLRVQSCSLNRNELKCIRIDRIRRWKSLPRVRLNIAINTSDTVLVVVSPINNIASNHRGRRTITKNELSRFLKTLGDRR